ncbi:MAG: preprotein translocase subunit YajC [Microbacteriaceae bacterium]|jgi:preprotein translocase subunit YajC|nr:preprotein translocase subunit YajC [Microbacteriaceae bacterium]
MNDTILNIALVVVLAMFVFYAFRNSRKTKAKQAELKSQIVPGVEVMTNFGLFGTLISVDEISNVAEIETSPGNIVRVHRQTLAKVVTETEAAEGQPRSVEEAMEIANREAEARERAASGATPEFGELAEPTATHASDEIFIEPTTPTTDPAAKPATPTSKKVDE